MSEMVERVAIALYEADHGKAGENGSDPPWDNPAATTEGWDDFLEAYHEDQKQAYRERARIAIAAIREPTEAMIEASNREWDGRMSHRSSGAWRAMIDEALKPIVDQAE